MSYAKEWLCSRQPLYSRICCGEALAYAPPLKDQITPRMLTSSALQFQ